MEKTEGLKLPSVLLKGEIALSHPRVRARQLSYGQITRNSAPAKIFPGTIVQSLIDDLLDEYFKMNGYSRSGDLTKDSKSLSFLKYPRARNEIFLIQVEIFI